MTGSAAPRAIKKGLTNCEPPNFALQLEVDIDAHLHGVEVQIDVGSLAAHRIDPIVLFAKIIVAVFRLDRPAVVNGIFGAKARGPSIMPVAV